MVAHLAWPVLGTVALCAAGYVGVRTTIQIWRGT